MTFDSPLAPVVSDTRNYFTRWVNVERDAASATVLPGTPTILTIPTAVVGADMGPDVIQYVAGFPDLVGQNGLPVAPFLQGLVAV